MKPLRNGQSRSSSSSNLGGVSIISSVLPSDSNAVKTTAASSPANFEVTFTNYYVVIEQEKQLEAGFSILVK